MGYGDFHANSWAEALLLILFMVVNIALGAYILGTITLLVVKGDEATGKFRDKMHTLEGYSQVGGWWGAVRGWLCCCAVAACICMLAEGVC